MLQTIPEWLKPLHDFVKDLRHDHNGNIRLIKFEIPAGQVFNIDFKQFRHEWHFNLKVHDIRLDNRNIKRDMAISAKTLILTRKAKHNGKLPYSPNSLPGHQET